MESVRGGKKNKMSEKKIYKNLLVEMVRLGILQKDVAILIKVSPSTFSKKMSRSTLFTIDECFIIKNAFSRYNPTKEYTIDYLFELC